MEEAAPAAHLLSHGNSFQHGIFMSNARPEPKNEHIGKEEALYIQLNNVR
jgi:hypothetical protein